MKSRKLLFWILISAYLCLGFRVFDDEHPWDRINRSTATSSKLFVVYDRAAETLVNDLPGSEPLSGTGTITVEQAMDSVFDDYNNIQAAFVTLVDDADADYAANNERRTIFVRNQDTDGVVGGQAEYNVDDQGMVSCEISLTDDMYKDAKLYIGVVTHEIGHCLGLDHPQEHTKSVMSYFTDADENYRLQADDKMGIIFLYPTDPSKAKEDATWGLACSRR